MPAEGGRGLAQQAAGNSCFLERRRPTSVDELSSLGLLSTGLWPRVGCGFAGSRGRLLPWAVRVFCSATGVIVFHMKRYHRLSGRGLPPPCGEGSEPKVTFRCAILPVGRRDFVCSAVLFAIRNALLFTPDRAMAGGRRDSDGKRCNGACPNEWMQRHRLRESRCNGSPVRLDQPSG